MKSLAARASAAQEILRYPPTQELTTPQRDLLWKFRFYLTRDKRALTKFLKSVVWSDPGEAKQAVETLLPMWSEIEMDDALELLGPAEGFRDRRVRAYAVRQLERADDDVGRCARNAAEREADPSDRAGADAIPSPTRPSTQVRTRHIVDFTNILSRLAQRLAPTLARPRSPSRLVSPPNSHIFAS